MTTTAPLDDFSCYIKNLIISIGGDALWEVYQLAHERCSPCINNNTIELLKQIACMVANHQQYKTDKMQLLLALDLVYQLSTISTWQEKKLLQYVVETGAEQNLKNFGLKVFAAMFTRILDELGAENFLIIELEMPTTNNKSVIVSIQKKGHKTPKDRIDELEAAIRRHRDYEGFDRCHRDDVELYEVLPEGVHNADLRLPSMEEMIPDCVRYIYNRHDPKCAHYSPQAEITKAKVKIAELEKEIETLKQGTNAT